MKRFILAGFLALASVLQADMTQVGPTIPPNPWDDTSCPGGETGCNPW